MGRELVLFEIVWDDVWKQCQRIAKVGEHRGAAKVMDAKAESENLWLGHPEPLSLSQEPRDDWLKDCGCHIWWGFFSATRDFQPPAPPNIGPDPGPTY